MNEKIVIKGAKEHNLKNVNLEIPRDKLVVITGLSGSGKSSLAFDTIYAEGQRRYMESLSSYARQFLGRMEKPNVEEIEGLSPAISIDQKTTSKNPRSTVATVTEIHDYFRLLYARIGIPHCPVCGQEIRSLSVDQIVDSMMALGEGTRLTVMAPVVRMRKGEHEKIIERIRKEGFTKVRIDGEMHQLDDGEEIKLEKNIKHTIEIVIDRVIAREGQESRIAEAVELGISHGDGLITCIVQRRNGEELCEEELKTYNTKLACPDHGITIEEMEPRIFSFNAPFGSCRTCNGLGFIQKIDPDLLYTKTGKKMPIEIVHYYQKRYEATYSDYFKDELARFTTTKVCPDCEGKRLRKEVLAVTVGGKSIADVCDMSVARCLEFFKELKLTPTEEKIAHQIMKEIISRLQFLKDVGLDYLTLSRSSATLSGGESQRIRLATQIGSSLMGVLYILDEPSIGLHQKDNEKLLATLRHLTDIGNTLIVVEHDEDTMYAADYIVDVGPGAGLNGGEIVAAGSIDDIKACKESVTGQYLRGERKIEVPSFRRPGNGKSIKVIGAKEHNLQNVDVEFPLGKFICVTGVSGSGKSSLVNEILYKSAARSLYDSKEEPGEHKELKGLENIDKVINIDQSPIGRTPRSNPATYTGVFTYIRDLFAELPESKLRGYSKGRFSFNVKGGRCESCGGDGIIKIEMHFLSDVYVPCEVCHSQRYNRETLEVKYKGKSINDILEMNVTEALEFFKNIPSIVRQLETLEQVGLGYVKLGQPSTQLSGGEAQRVKLASELSKRSTGRTLYILDEPTTGLHFADVDRLLQVLDRLVETGNTVVVIEHNLDVIKKADYIIDMGPDGGDRGGKVVVTGTPEEVAKHKTSYTAEFLRKIL